jgi:hypothetical protein
MEEERAKTTFAMEWGSFAYIVMPFGLKNSPALFSRIVVTTFKESMNFFMEVYLGDWTMFTLLKEHRHALRLILDK